MNGTNWPQPIVLANVVAWIFVWFVVGFRVLGILFLVIALIIGLRSGKFSRFAWSLLLVITLGPVDIPISSITTIYRGGGQHRSGPRLIHYQVGKHSDQELIDIYGEYYLGGCQGYCIVPPRWMLVLY